MDLSVRPFGRCLDVRVQIAGAKIQAWIDPRNPGKTVDDALAFFIQRGMEEVAGGVLSVLSAGLEVGRRHRPIVNAFSGFTNGQKTPPQRPPDRQKGKGVSGESSA